MKITIRRKQAPFHLLAENEDGNQLETDASPNIGGANKGMRPMQLLLVAIGSCSGIDVIDIIKKQRQELEDITIEVSGEREPNKIPSLFESVHIHYTLYGDLDAGKAARAIDLSIEKYCSVVKIMEKTAKITYSFDIKPFTGEKRPTY